MDISLQSLFWFIIITIAYFTVPSIGKPELTLDILTNNGDENQSTFYKKNLLRLVFYLLAVMFSQFFLNVAYLANKCGSSIDKNMGAAAVYTFIPWLLIFGIMLAILIIFPGFKSAFSDVLGYYAISGSANDLFSEILINTDINDAIANQNGEEQKKLSVAAEAIMKICGNTGILINQINPSNLLDIWKKLAPLMKTEFRLNDNYDGPDAAIIKLKELLKLVILKENVGEAFWYIYTAILISSIVYYNLATRGCIKSVDQLKSEHDNYIKQQEEADKQQLLNNSTTYTIE